MFPNESPEFCLLDWLKGPLAHRQLETSQCTMSRYPGSSPLSLLGLTAKTSTNHRPFPPQTQHPPTIIFGSFTAMCPTSRAFIFILLRAQCSLSVLRNWAFQVWQILIHSLKSISCIRLKNLTRLKWKLLYHPSHYKWNWKMIQGGEGWVEKMGEGGPKVPMSSYK